MKERRTWRTIRKITHAHTAIHNHVSPDQIAVVSVATSAWEQGDDLTPGPSNEIQLPYIVKGRLRIGVVST